MKAFFGALGLILALMGAHAAFHGNVCHTIYSCFGAYLCYDIAKGG